MSAYERKAAIWREARFTHLNQVQKTTKTSTNLLVRSLNVEKGSRNRAKSNLMVTLMRESLRDFENNFLNYCF